MGYSIVYNIPFKSLRNDSFEIQILKENHIGGSPIELIGGADPLVISLDDEDFLYAPLRKSSCKITIVGSDYLQDLYSSNFQECKVNIYRNKQLIWTGFIVPETYTQDYTNSIIELTVEASSALSVLEDIKYETKKRDWVTIWDYLKKVIKASKGDFRGIIIPDTYQRETGNIFEDLQLSESNFFDEDGEPMMILETLEELCKFLNWTVSDWDGYLSFTDIDFTGTYRLYDRELSNYTTITPTSYSVQNIGFNGGDHSLDILPGYTKATVKVNNYNVDGFFEKFDFDDLNVLETFKDGFYLNDGGSFTMWQYLTEKNDFEVYHYNNDNSIMSTEEYEKDLSMVKILGSTRANTFSYKGVINENVEIDYEQTKISYKSVILVRAKTNRYTQIWPRPVLVDKPIFRITRPDYFKYPEGVLCLKLTVEALTWISEPDGMHLNEALIPYTRTNGISGLKVLFRLGKYWWNGDKWVTTQTTFKLPLNTESTTGYMQIKTNKKLFVGPNNAEGYVFDLYTENAPKQIMGDIECIIYSSNEYYEENVGGFHLGDVELSFEPLENQASKESKGDRLYENIVNSSLIKECDEIEFKISSHNNDGISHSKLLLDGEYLTNNLYSRLADKTIRPEEQLLTRIINQYRQAKIKLTQQLEFKEILPIDIITDQYYKDKVFTITGAEYSAASSQLVLNIIENERH